MKTSDLHNLINFRGMKEQSFKFAFGYKGGMKQCFTRGCEIFCPLTFALKDADLSQAIIYSRIIEGEYV